VSTLYSDVLCASASVHLYSDFYLVPKLVSNLHSDFYSVPQLVSNLHSDLYFVPKLVSTLHSDASTGVHSV
jgi:hypothetical protein